LTALQRRGIDKEKPKTSGAFRIGATREKIEAVIELCPELDMPFVSVTDQWSVAGPNDRRVLQTIVYPRSVVSKIAKIRIVATEDTRWDIATIFF
jgi:hypothetical protein